MTVLKQTKRLMAFLLVMGMLATGAVIAAPAASADTYYSASNAVAYHQSSSPWGSYYYDGTISSTGCGILSTTNGINFLHGSFNTSAKAAAFIDELATYAHSINAFNPGSASGTYRYVLFGTDISNPPPLQTKYGSTYNFTMPITWTENWNSANYYNGSYYNNIYVSSQTKLKTYLQGDAVAIAHVPGHFICLADYDSTTDKFLVLDSYPTNARGTYSTGGVTWVSSANLSGGWPALTVGGFCVLQSTVATVKYPYEVDSNTLMLYDGESTSGLTTAYSTNAVLNTADKKQGSSSLKLTYNSPAANASTTKIGGMAVQTLSSSANLSNYSYVTMDLYLSRDLTGSNGLQINFATTGEDGYNAIVVLNEKTAGWHTVTLDLSKISMAATADWSNINKIRYTWFNYAGSTASTYFLIDNVKAVKEVGTSVTYPYTVDANTLMLYDGESTATLKAALGAEISLNTTKTQGSNSLKMNYTTPVANPTSKIAGTVLLPLSAATDLSGYESVTFDLYLSRAMTGSNGFQLNFCTTNQDGYNFMKGINDFEAGWHTITVNLADLTKTLDTADWTQINTLRFAWFNYAQTDTATYFLIDNVRAVKSGASSETPNANTVKYPYMLDDNTMMLYDGEKTDTLATAHGVEVSLDTTKTQGSNSLKMNYTTPVANPTSKIGGTVQLPLSAATDLSSYSEVIFDLYLSREMTGSNGFQLNFCTTNQDGYNYMKAINDFAPGWNTFTVNLADLTKTLDTADWTQINTLRFAWFNYNQTDTATYFLIDNVRAVKTGASSVTYPYVADENTLMLYDGESLTQVTTAFKTEAAKDSANKTQGDNGLKMTYTDPLAQAGDTGNKVGGMTYIALNSTADVSGYETLRADIYLPQDIADSNGFQINLCSEKSDGFNFMKALKGLKVGWNSVEFDLASATPASGVAYADKTDINTLRFTWFNYSSSEIPYIIIDNVRVTKTPEVVVDQAVEAVIAAIDALPAVSQLTASDADAVYAAEAMYNDLTVTQQVNVTNSQKLKALLTALKNLPVEDESVNAVIKAIDGLPEVGEVTEDDADQINAVKDMFDDLTADQQQKVTNQNKLQDLLDKLETLSEDILYGDINNDGAVNAADALMALQSAVDKLTLTEQQFKVGNVDGNTQVNAQDALCILQKAVGKLAVFPVEA